MSNLWKIVELASGNLKLLCLPGIGGRLWDIVLEGQSLLFQNPDLIDCIPIGDSLEALPTKSPQFGFPLWGGEKTWIAPDSDWVDGAPFPVLDSAPHRVVSNNALQLTTQSQTCPISHIQIERSIRIETPFKWTIDHKIINCGSTSRFVGIWSVMMLKRPARIGLKWDEREKLSTVFGDPAGHIDFHEPFLVFDCQRPGEFKSATINGTGRVVVLIGGVRGDIGLTCDTPPPVTGDQFAHNHNFEVFNSGDYPYLKAEWHAPAQRLKPGASTKFTQQFKLWSTRDAGLFNADYLMFGRGIPTAAFV